MRTYNDPMRCPTPETQVECDLFNASREYNQAHKVWFNTPVWHNHREKAELDRTREAYIAAYKAVYPTHIVF